MISRIERTLHRRGRNLKSLEKENIDKTDNNDGEDDGINPFSYKPLFDRSFFSPKTPMDLLGKDGVKNDHTSEKKPIISELDHPRRVKCAVNRELHPPRR